MVIVAYSKGIFFTIVLANIFNLAYADISSDLIDFRECKAYDTMGQAAEATNSKDQASLYLNAALNRMEAEFDGPLTAAEIQKRDACAIATLQNGADANNTLGYTAPLLMAISSNDEVAAYALLQYKADPNILDQGLSGGTISALHRACESGNEKMALDLINAGADPKVNEVLWTASSSAESQVVDAIIKTGKVPVNQLIKFSDLDTDEDAQTALDASDYRIDSLNNYFKNQANATKDAKLTAANSILYSLYIMAPQLKSTDDPDSAMKDLLNKQTQISTSLKAAGWSCHQKNCGIEVYSDDSSEQ